MLATIAQIERCEADALASAKAAARGHERQRLGQRIPVFFAPVPGPSPPSLVKLRLASMTASVAWGRLKMIPTPLYCSILSIVSTKIIVFCVKVRPPNDASERFARNFSWHISVPGGARPAASCGNG
ncbi:hypothetical protein [Pseudooceanicola sp. 200-1SW]|uniref:hypothetical protein n=1 Tax=Pseudooceanicola sp. 200-1SW TaxID=3425949 RepID=UPI003D7FD033